MGVFKATKNASTAGVFKATKNRSYDSAFVSRLEDENRESSSRLNDYITRRQADEWMSEDDIQGYRDALERYRSSSKALSDFGRTLGSYNDEDEKQRTSYIDSIATDLDSSSSMFKSYKNADEYGAAVSAYKEREAMKTASLDDISSEITALERELASERQKIGSDSALSWYPDKAKDFFAGTNITGIQSDLDAKRDYYNKVKEVQDYENHTAAELYKLADEAAENTDSLYWRNLANRRDVQEKSNALAGIRMDGERVTVLEALNDLSSIEDGNSRRQREKAIKNKMASLGLDFDDYYSRIAGEGNFSPGDAWKWAKSALLSGTASWNKGISSTADLILGKPLQALGWEKNPISAAADYYSDSYNNYAFDRSLYANKMGGGKALDYAGQFVEGVVSAVPDAILAGMTAGASAGVGLTSGGLAAKAAYQSGDKLTKAGLTIEGMMKNPNYWSSFARTYGLDYEEAKASGASDTAAALGATITSLINAGIEIGFDGGSGFQGLAQDLAEGGRNKFWAWAESSLEEGGEEILQGFVNNLVSKVMYDDSTELANIEQMIAEGGMGVAVGAALGGGEVILRNAANSAVRNQEIKKAMRNFTEFSGKSIVEGDTVRRLVESAGTLGNKRAEQKLKVLAESIAGVDPTADGFSQKSKSRLEKSAGKLYRGLVEAKGESFENSRRAAISDGIRKELEVVDVKDIDRTVSVLTKYAVGDNLTKSEKALMDMVGGKSIVERVMKSGVDENTARAYADYNSSAALPFVSREDTELGGKKHVDVRDRVSSTGYTVKADTGENITVNKENAIDRIENGEAYINTDKGTVKLSNIEFANENEARLYESFLDYDSATASALIKNYDGGISVERYVNGMRQGINVYGKYNFQGVGIDISKDSFFADLSPTDQRYALNIGRSIARAEAQAAQRAVAAKTAAKTRGKVQFAEGVTAETKAQKNGVALAKHLASALGINITFFDSTKDVQHRNDNGWYDPATDSIHLDINAGDNHEGTIAYTLGHELTHYIKKWSPEKFKVFGDFLVEQYGKHGISTQEMLEAQMSKLNTTDEAIAYEEMVADACQTMLLDSNAVEKLIQLRQQDKGLFEKIKEFIHNILAKLRKEYAGIDHNSDEAKALRSMTDVMEQMSALFEDAAVDAAQAHSQAAEAVGDRTDIRYSFRNTKSGMANDSLKPYSAELTDIITGNGDFIVDSFDALVNIVNLAFDEPTKKATAYFGNLDESILEKIKSSIPNLPIEYRQEGMLFKKGMDYSVAATLDNIRHLIDEKGLSKADVIDYLDRLADTIADFDTVNFSYYTESRGNKLPGLRFKKTFSDGTFVSFEIPSKKRTRLSMQTMFMEHADYKKRKSAEPPLMQTAPAHTPEVRGGQTSKNSVAHGSQDVKTSIRNKSNRELLSEALETTIDTSTPMGQYEAKLLGQYRDNVELLDGLQAHLKEVNAEIRALTFGDAPRDPARLRALKDEKIKTENRIGIYDKKLLRLEATQPLKDVLEREKKRVKQETMTAFRESTKERKAQSEIKGKLKRVIKSLDQLLNHGTKERNVKADMQDTVGAVLSLGSVLFNDEITNEDIVKMGAQTATPEEQKLLDKYMEYIRLRDNSEFNEALKYISKISALNSRLSELFARERERLNRTKVADAVTELSDAYARLKNSGDDFVSFAYDSDVAGRIAALKEELGGTTVRDMTNDQLRSVYEVFRMVKHMVSTSNNLFRMGKAQSLSDTTRVVQSEVLKWMIKEHGDPNATVERVAEQFRSFGWNELKPVYAFERLGSDTYMQLFWDAINAEGVWARDVEEAKTFLDAQVRRTGYRTWDMQEAHEFRLPNGQTFKLTLQEMMSIYAYSKREQAYEHMTVGGFQFAENSEYRENGRKKLHSTGELYTVDADTIKAIIEALTPQQAAYVDAVQSYLTELGKKGNEVSRALYGIDLFTEKVYFPLMSARDYRSSVETALNATQTQASLKNTGMSKPTVPHAKNPIILQGFDAVVNKHIDTMSKYHAYVLPIENLRRVFDSTTIRSDGRYVSTKNIIKRVYGKAAMEYFENYITDLNGGTFIPGYNNPVMGMFSKFKATAVGASLSVIIQQPFAIIRAMNMISPQYFVFGKVGERQAESRYAEIKKYAPVAIIKEMGGFDMGNSRTAAEYLTTRTDKGLKRTMDTISNAAQWGAGKADELGWGIIWDAVKRETYKKGFKYGSKEFYEACGKRFTEVITYTQVYDSVNSRSGMMRSKHDSVKFATSFMGEPTTVINMAYSAILKVQRAKGSAATRKAFVALMRTAGVLLASALLNGAAKSLVYAGRDDDDDEAYFERWAKQFAGSMHPLTGDISPLTMLPYVKDIVSLFQGYDVERPDMTLIANVVSDIIRVIDKWDDMDLDTALSLIGDVGNLCGLPLKNIIRDTRGVVNTIGDAFDSVYPTDIGGALMRGFSGENQSNTDALYGAIVRKDSGRIEVIRNKYKTDASYETAVKRALRENDPRITEALKARVTGDNARYQQLRQQIIEEGNFDKQIVNDALKAEYDYYMKKIEKAAKLMKEGDTVSSGDIILELKKQYKGVFKQDDIMAMVKRKAGLLK